MLGFDISVNGNRIATVGADCVLATTVTWSPAEKSNARLHVGGIVTRDGTRLHANWDKRYLNIGDELSIRIVETDSSDEPVELYPRDKED